MMKQKKKLKLRLVNNMGKKQKIILILIPIIILIIKYLFFIPVHLTGGFAGIEINSHINIFNYISYLIHGKVCIDCYDYHIMWFRYIWEGIITWFIATFSCFIIYFIYFMVKGEKKHV